MQKERLENLDVLRGLAALAVVFAHTVGLSDVPVPHGTKIWQGLFSLAVPMFFALSAFSLAYQYQEKLHSRSAIAEFAVRRFFRIAPLFYAILAFDIIRRIVKWGYIPPADELLANVSFLFGFSPAFYQSQVAAGWSIGVEMIFYAALPVLFLVIRSFLSAIIATVVALVAGYAAYIATAHLKTSFSVLNALSSSPNFMAGIAAYFAFRRLSQRTIAERGRWSAAMLGVAALVWVGLYYYPTLFGPPYGYGWRYFLSAAFPFIVLAGALSNWGRFANKWTLNIGLWSYSIYLLHPLILLYVIPIPRKAIYATLSGYPTWVPFTISSALVYALVLPSAYLAWRLIERPCQGLGKRLTLRPQNVLAAAE